jgi:succinyl-diaminopimelate desuccinylase
MKSSLAAFVCACEQLDAIEHLGIRIGLLLTSDEEGPAEDGIRAVTQALSELAGPIDWCLVGEPSSHAQLGDVIRIGRRGSLSAAVRFYGQQGHVAYPAGADNPVPRLAAFLAALSATHWDEGNAAFPPTSLQITQLATDTHASNVVPGEASAQFNLRFAPTSSADSLRVRVEQLIEEHAGDRPSAVDWHLSAEPIANTAGGTSDGRFIAPLGAEVIEFGPVNASIHQVDERIKLDELGALSDCYKDIILTLSRITQAR